MYDNHKKIGFRKAVSGLMLLCFLSTTIVPNSCAQEISLPTSGTMVNLSASFNPPLLKGIKVYPDNPFKLDFILDKGDSKISAEDLKTESVRLLKYFLASITVPEKDLWVNLSPYEKDRIIPSGFGITEMGRDLLAQDYILKQITASVLYPDEKIGKEFWNKIYSQVKKQFGVKDVPVNTFNKVWIVPEKAIVYENKSSIYIVESHLKVLLEEDYLALQRGIPANGVTPTVKETNKLATQMMREVIIPILEKEVNEGKNFVQLRQLYSSLILAIWFKDTIKESILGQAYIENNKIAGVDIEDKLTKNRIWEQYVDAFKKGTYNYIKEDYDAATDQTVVRKYFSGGVGLGQTREKILISDHLPNPSNRQMMLLSAGFNPVSSPIQANTTKTLSGPKDIAIASQILALQDANIIFELRNGRWIFRRGGIELEIPPALTDQLSAVMKKQQHHSILISLRQNDAKEIDKIITELLSSEEDLVAIFAKHNIKASYHYKKVLLVAPSGDVFDRPLKYVLPHKGVALLAHRLLRETDDTDAVVYDPNLGSEEGLYELVRNEHFDFIGLSISQPVMKSNLRVMGQLKILTPDSFFIVGGNEMHKFPVNKIFESWPIDLISYDAGTSMISLIKSSLVGQSNENIKELAKSIPNTAMAFDVENASVKSVEIVKNRRVEKDPIVIPADLYSETPFDSNDVFHMRHYETINDDQRQPQAYDRIGKNPFRIRYSDWCAGTCIFCGTIRNRQREVSPEQVVELIKKRPEDTDSVHFEVADIFFSPEEASALFRTLADDYNVRDIPKMSIARTDLIGDGRILEEMSRAGFTKIAYGIESFSDRVLAGIKKGTTREQNINAMNRALEHGIQPGMNLIFFTPWDTVDTMTDTINESLNFMDRGAFPNVVYHLFVGFGNPISRMDEIIDYETFDFPGLKAPFRFPHEAKILDPELAALRSKVYKRFSELDDHNPYPVWVKRSVSIFSLLWFKAFVEVVKAQGLRKDIDYDKYLQRIEANIQRVIVSEESTLFPEESLARGMYDQNLSVPVSTDETTFKLNPYLSAKFPFELLDAVARKEALIELHRAPLSMSLRYIEGLAARGYDVQEFSAAAAPAQHRFFRVQKGREIRYLIVGILGESRELFIAQALTQFFKYPLSQIKTRNFLQSFDYVPLFNEVLGSYAGTIKRGVILYSPEKYANDLVVQGYGRIIKHIQGDYVNGVIFQLNSGEQILLFDLQYANGEHIAHVIDYLASPVKNGGFGMEDLTFYGTVGGVGDINVNDVILFDNIYWDTAKISSPPNDIQQEKFQALLTPDIKVHTMNIYTIPTVLNASKQIIQKIYDAGGGGIELELAHAARVAQRFPNLKFRAMCEISDIPAGFADGEDLTLRREVPGLSTDKHQTIAIALAEYLFPNEINVSSSVEDIYNGGIDFTRGITGLRVQSSGNPIQFKFSPLILDQLKNAAGFKPVIINIQPMINLQIFLGLKNNVQQTELVGMR